MRVRQQRLLRPNRKTRGLRLESLESRRLCAVDGTAFTIPEPVAKLGGAFAPGQTNYADVNGDGKADMMFQSTNNQFWLSLSTGSGFANPRLVATHGGPFAPGQTSYADINGDRLADMIFQGTDNRFWLSLSNGRGFGTPRHVFTHGGAFAAKQTGYADVNGDGKADMVFQGADNRFWLSYSTGTGFAPAKHVMTHGGPFAPGQTSYADINGDRLVDMIFQGADNRFWLSYSTGRGFLTPVHVMTHVGSFQPGQTGYSDINGDGRADMIFQGTDNSFWLSLSTGGGFRSPELVMKHGDSFGRNQTGYADVTGDGKGDMVFQGTDNTFWMSKGVNSIPLLNSNNAADVHLNSVGAPAAWAQGFTGKGVVVAVVDTGVQAFHREFGNRVVNGFDFVDNDFNSYDQNGHGTHVAGIIAASRNGIRTTGIAYEANILAVRVLGSNGGGTADAVALGIRHAVDLGAKIINLSLGYNGSISAIERNAIAYAESKNVLIVAAAGNDSPRYWEPSALAKLSREFGNVISVGNFVTGNMTLNTSSQRVGGSLAYQVDAPGTDIDSTYSDGQYRFLTGTSMAAPFVSGLAALALSANPWLTAADLKSAIVFGANQSIRLSDSSGGINAALTIAIAMNSRGGSGSNRLVRSGMFGTGYTLGGHAFAFDAMDLPLEALPFEALPTSKNSTSLANPFLNNAIANIAQPTPEDAVAFGQVSYLGEESASDLHSCFPTAEQHSSVDTIFASSLEDILLDHSQLEESILCERFVCS